MSVAFEDMKRKMLSDPRVQAAFRKSGGKLPYVEALSALITIDYEDQEKAFHKDLAKAQADLEAEKDRCAKAEAREKLYKDRVFESKADLDAERKRARVLEAGLDAERKRAVKLENEVKDLTRELQYANKRLEAMKKVIFFNTTVLA